ncbi:hypothetical protein AK812_SmicGene30683 [Symbiodinium microadriaticum]|uniref:Uncharacterized protein n=1 Tax=Symbiodinium microadriaticum TaxID=2951 RepID=A0A1Q9CYM8_SYMMI|nr:hypothetical protein AK812_SmicGene30683 [Symbiodinium microadriaticum]
MPGCPQVSRWRCEGSVQKVLTLKEYDRKMSRCEAVALQTSQSGSRRGHVHTHWQLLACIGRKDMDVDDPCTEILAAAPTVSSLWTVPVSKHSVAVSLTETLATAVLKLRSTSPGVRKSNRGGWHSNTSVLDAVSPSLARKLRLILLGAAGQYISQVTEAVSNIGSQRLTGVGGRS